MSSIPDDELTTERRAAAAAAADLMLRDPLSAHPFMVELISVLSERSGRTRLFCRERMFKSLLVDTRVEAAHAVKAGIDRGTYLSLLTPELRVAFERYLCTVSERVRTARADARPDGVKPKVPEAK